MDRINKLFSNKKHDILSIYFCAGAPKADNTTEVITSLEKNGVDMIEIGIPFSDPLADGPVIQNASCQALRNGMTLTGLFAQLEGIRNTISIPLILMGYLNPIMQYGTDSFFESCHRTGIDGVIIPDLPFDEYMQSVKPVAEKYGIVCKTRCRKVRHQSYNAHHPRNIGRKDPPYRREYRRIHLYGIISCRNRCTEGL